MKKIALVMSMFAFSGMALAQTSIEPTDMVKRAFSNTAISAKAGLNGVGFDVTKSFNENFKMRAGYSEMSFNKEHTEDDVIYDGKLTLGGWNLLADIYPMGGGGRVTVGVYGPKSKFDARGKYLGNGTVTLNDVVYSGADVGNLKANVKWNGTKPYLGIGYDGFNMKPTGFFFTSDIGVIFAGRPEVNVSANCNAGAELICASLARDIAQEQANFRDDARKAKWLPVVQVGVGYRF